MASRKDRLEQLLHEIDPSTNASPEALELLDSLVTKVVVEALSNGRMKADDRNSQEIRICDLRPLVQDSLGLDVVGFAVDDLVDEAAVGSRFVLSTLKRNEPNKRHLKRVAEKQAMLGIKERKGGGAAVRESQPDKDHVDHAVPKKKRKKLTKDSA